MLAAVVKGVKDVVMEEVQKPEVQNPTDVLLKVTTASLCTSDVHIVNGYLPPSPPFVIGHEFVGVVEDAGSGVTKYKAGDRVAVPPLPYCGLCAHCRKGMFGQCLNSAVFGSGATWGNMPGAFAQYVRVPHADTCLVPIPDGISDEEAVFVGDMLTTGYFAAENCSLKPGATVAVFGAGPVGLCAVHTASLFNPAKIILVDAFDYRLEMGKKMGATHTINFTQNDAVDEIMALTGGRGADAAIEAVGDQKAVNDAAHVTGVGGTLSIVGLFPGNIEFPIQDLLMKNVTTKVGLSYLGNMPMLMGLLAEKKLDATPLITHRMPLDSFEQAYDIFSGKKDNVVKIILTP